MDQILVFPVEEVAVKGSNLGIGMVVEKRYLQMEWINFNEK
jgi:hypothetical protein